MLNIGVVVRPNKYRLLGLINIPQVNVLALPRHSQLLLVLPLYLSALKARVEFSVVKGYDDFASLRVPDCDHGGHASRCNHFSVVLVELGHHQHELEVLQTLHSLAVFLGLVLVVHPPHSSIAVRRTSDESVAALVPVHAGYIRHHCV